MDWTPEDDAKMLAIKAAKPDAPWTDIQAACGGKGSKSTVAERLKFLRENPGKADGEKSEAEKKKDEYKADGEKKKAENLAKQDEEGKGGKKKKGKGKGQGEEQKVSSRLLVFNESMTDCAYRMARLMARNPRAATMSKHGLMASRRRSGWLLRPNTTIRRANESPRSRLARWLARSHESLINRARCAQTGDSRTRSNVVTALSKSCYRNGVRQCYSLAQKVEMRGWAKPCSTLSGQPRVKHFRLIA